MATCIYKQVYVILLRVHGYYLVMDGPNESILLFQKKLVQTTFQSNEDRSVSTHLAPINLEKGFLFQISFLLTLTIYSKNLVLRPHYQ
jgi:hypothetical protein